MRYNIKAVAEMAERSNAHDSKSCYAGMYTRVQIPFSAPRKRKALCLPFFVAWIRLAGSLELSRVHASCERKKDRGKLLLGEQRRFVALQ